MAIYMRYFAKSAIFRVESRYLLANCAKQAELLSFAKKKRLLGRELTNQRYFASSPGNELKEKPNSEGGKRKPAEVVLDGDLTIKKFAKQIGASAGSIIKLLKDAGEDIGNGIHTTLDLDTAEFVALEFGVQPVLPDIEAWEKSLSRTKSHETSELLPRSPVVTIMGHVDHGKTTLLDNLRKTAVAQGEAGGITQHIGAFSVPLASGKTITFIDTPGHAAFNAMRGRGARVTDIVVLVVSAEEGVKEQTLECIRHAKEAQVPIIVAINKIDRNRANPAKVKEELLQHGIQLEDYGGEIPSVEISALKGTNLDLLIEVITAQAELSELKTEWSGPGEGVVLEAQTHKQKGLVASVLVQKGKLHRGNSLLAGNAFAKVRQLFDDNGRAVSEATPSMPVQVLGWRGLPSLGDHFLVVDSEDIAKKIIRMNEIKARRERAPIQSVNEVTDAKSNRSKPKETTSRRRLPVRIQLRREASLQSSEQPENKKPKLSIVVKADYSGTLEAILDILNGFKSDRIELEIANSGCGQISESDINLADAIDGTVYGFNVTVSKDIEKLSKRLEVPLKNYNVIYKLMDDVKDELCSRLPELPEETFIGEANVLMVFQLTGQRKALAAGCRVKKGTLTAERDLVWRVIRNDQVIHQGPLKSLKHGKLDISLAKKETECGVVLEKFTDFQVDDKIQCVKISYVKQSLDWNN